MGLLDRVKRLFGVDSGGHVPAPEGSETGPPVRELEHPSSWERSSAPVPTAVSVVLPPESGPTGPTNSHPNKTPVVEQTHRTPADESGALLRHLAGGADRIVVVDCETTGVYPTDRIVELAIVTIGLDGTILEGWDTLVQPRRHVGASHIHGLTADSLADAPEFGDIAADVAVRIDGACVAAHNLPFDRRMLSSEFAHLGSDLFVASGIDTLRATRARLMHACELHDVQLINAHSAIGDALATAELLLRVANACEPGEPATIRHRGPRTRTVYRRADRAPVVLPDPPVLVALANSMRFDGVKVDSLAYLDLVGRALDDLHLDEDERAQLRSLAAETGLTDAEVSQAHRRYLNELVDAAVDDHVVTREELDALLRVAAALDVNPDLIERRTNRFTRQATDLRIDAGMSVTFTGDDPRYGREAAVAHAEQLGLTVGKGVTKKSDFVVADEVDSQSGKAAKARSYGVPIVALGDFMAATLGGSVEAVGSSIDGLKAVQCPECRVTWTVPARSGQRASKRCEECSKASTSRKQRRPAASLGDAGRASRLRPVGAMPDGVVRGRHYTDWVETVKGLKRDGKLDEAVQLLRQCADATEDEASASGCGVAPWYFEQLAICFRKQKDFEAEIAILERFCALPHAPGASPPKLLERLGKARELQRRS